MSITWAQVDVNGNVLGGPFGRPAAFRLNDGTTVNLGDLPDDQLAQYGLYPCENPGTSYDPVALIEIEPTLTFDRANSVVVATSNFMDRDLTDAQGIMTARINDYRDCVLEDGWIFNGVLYDSDPRSVQNMAGTQTLINAGFKLPDNFMWRAKDNTDHPFNNTMFPMFFIAAGQWRSAAFTVSWTHKANILAMTNSHDVAAYDFTVGWYRGFNLTDSGLVPVY